MTKEGLADFLYSLEHSASLRREIQTCHDDNDLIQLAKDNGFLISQIDLETTEESSEVEKWFNKSNINPIKK